MLRYFHDGDDLETVIGDLLCDIGHLCDVAQVDFDDLVQDGRRHYRCEAFGSENFWDDEAWAQSPFSTLHDTRDQG
jgi:hypothetical protein